MSAPCPKLQVLAAGPGISVQVLGRFGYLGQGVSASGAADPIAMHEGAALLGQKMARLPIVAQDHFGGFNWAARKNSQAVGAMFWGMRPRAIGWGARPSAPH